MLRFYSKVSVERYDIQKKIISLNVNEKKGEMIEAENKRKAKVLEDSKAIRAANDAKRNRITSVGKTIS